MASWLDFGSNFFGSSLEYNCSFKPWTATFARPIAGKSCIPAEWRPQPVISTLRYGAMRLMACMCLAGTVPVAASVCNGPPCGRTRPWLCWGYGYFNDLQFYDRKAQGGWNLVCLEMCLERFFGFCLGGLMRSADLSMFSWRITWCMYPLHMPCLIDLSNM